MLMLRNNILPNGCNGHHKMGGKKLKMDVEKEKHTRIDDL